LRDIVTLISSLRIIMDKKLIPATVNI